MSDKIKFSKLWLKQKGNVVTHGLRGKVGDLLVFRQKNGETVVSKILEPPNKMSKRQIKHQNAFRERQIYGKSIVTDPQLKELYEAEAKKKKGVTAYNIAVADYFNAPDIEDVDLKEYAGAAGDDNANITVNRESINRATGGGIVLGASTSLILSNLIISNNKTPFYGGGIYCKGGSPVVSNIQVTGNTATDGGGVYFKGDIRRV